MNDGFTGKVILSMGRNSGIGQAKAFAFSQVEASVLVSNISANTG